ncbi:MAG: hypothetical protein CEO19_63, partial [Parcubacteria group bacterium Gr01-1014_73]
YRTGGLAEIDPFILIETLFLRRIAKNSQL